MSKSGPDLADQFNRALRMSRRCSEDATSTSSTTEAPLEILYPELMTKDALIAQLRNRLPALDTAVNLNAQSKENLVELASKLIVPKPKRDYSEMRTRRAAALIAAQEKRPAYSLKLTSDHADGPSSKRRRDEQKMQTDNEEHTSDSNGITRKRKHSPIRFQ